ncbi:AAA family ATPase [Belliella sp. DSM 111904]|uniref:non-specific protein-tyrosine kinase n=1 Tax=Belliella filtrata TaxID=2923435 RepID=A0ABS9V340_9BACT|nr:tyrosine-protein kinase [Belliella filtrata]MCH7410834.1 AAA family ATPase [Belliella filtrata]
MKVSDVLLDGFGFERGIDPKKTVRKYLKYKWFFLLGISIALFLALTYLFYAMPLYQVSSKVVIKDREKGVDFSDNPLLQEFDSYRSSKIIENEIEVFKSVQLMKGVLEDLDILISVFSVDKFGRKKEFYKSDSPILINWENRDWKYELKNDEYKLEVLDKKTFRISFGNVSEKFKFGDQISGHFGDFSVSLNDSFDFSELESKSFVFYFHGSEDLARAYSQGLVVEPTNRQSSVLEISTLDNIPQRAVEIVDSLIKKYNLQTEEEKNSSATTAVSFLSAQLNELAMEIDSIESKIERLKSQNRISDIDTEARVNLERSANDRSQISNYRTQIQVVESIQNLLQNSSTEDTKTIPSALTLNDVALVGAIENYNSLQREKERLLRDVQPSSPLVVSLNARISSQRSNIVDNLNNLKSSLQIAVRNLEINSSRYEGRSSKIPQIERELQEITRLRLIKLEQFQMLNKKNEEAQMSLTATSNSFLRIIDTAKASYAPVKPNRIIILIFSIVMGFGIPFMIVFIKNLFDNKIDSKNDAENITQLPVISEISKNDMDENLVFSVNGKSAVAEQFRLLRANVFSTIGEKDTSIILVTSSMAGEGKTFCSLNLGASLNLIGKKVAVLEFDLRKPSLLRSLKMPKEQEGIIEYLLGETKDLNRILKKHPDLDNFWYIGAGKLVHNPAEVISMSRLDTLMDELSAMFDYIIIDTSPVGMVPDAFALCKYADLTLYVLRSNMTTSDHLAFLSNFGVKDKLKNPMLILNGVNVVNGYGYGYDYAPALT